MFLTSILKHLDAYSKNKIIKFTFINSLKLYYYGRNNQNDY